MRHDVAPPLANGRYRLLSVVGEGGMSTVYRAHDTWLDVYRAIKVLTPDLAAKRTIRRRFELEARTMARLRHPHIVILHDFGFEPKHTFIVMELIEGGTLMDLLMNHGPLPPFTACELVRSVCNALQAAHEKGIVHRDIKPHNVLLTVEGVPKVADFGIVRLSDEAEDRQSDTKSGILMGTWAYMAPEQRSSARAAEPRSDLYAAAATLYSLVTGREPSDLFATAADEDLFRETFDGVPQPVVDVIERAARYRARDRYDSAQQMGEALERAMAALPEVAFDIAPYVRPGVRQHSATNPGDAFGNTPGAAPSRASEPPAPPRDQAGGGDRYAPSATPARPRTGTPAPARRGYAPSAAPANPRTSTPGAARGYSTSTATPAPGPSRSPAATAPPEPRYTAPVGTPLPSRRRAASPSVRSVVPVERSSGPTPDSEGERFYAAPIIDATPGDAPVRSSGPSPSQPDIAPPALLTPVSEVGRRVEPAVSGHDETPVPAGLRDQPALMYDPDEVEEDVVAFVPGEHEDGYQDADRTTDVMEGNPFPPRADAAPFTMDSEPSEHDRRSLVHPGTEGRRTFTATPAEIREDDRGPVPLTPPPTSGVVRRPYRPKPHPARIGAIALGVLAATAAIATFGLAQVLIQAPAPRTTALTHQVVTVAEPEVEPRASAAFAGALEEPVVWRRRPAAEAADRASGGSAAQAQPAKGKLAIDSRPSSMVTVDGIEVDRTPWSANVAAGHHAVSLEAASGERVVRTIEVVGGKSATLCWDFDLDQLCAN